MLCIACLGLDYSQKCSSKWFLDHILVPILGGKLEADRTPRQAIEIIIDVGLVGALPVWAPAKN